MRGSGSNSSLIWIHFRWWLIKQRGHGFGARGALLIGPLLGRPALNLLNVLMAKNAAVAYVMQGELLFHLKPVDCPKRWKPFRKLVSHPCFSMSVICERGRWIGFHTDACMRPHCENTRGKTIAQVRGHWRESFHIPQLCFLFYQPYKTRHILDLF